MQFLNINAKISTKFFEAAVDVNAWIIRIIAAPNGYWRTPKSIATDCPVACVLKPLAKTSVLQVVWHPLNLFVQLDHAIANCCDLDKPRTHCPVNQRLASAPAMRISVIVSFVTNHNTAFFQYTNNCRVGVKNKLAFEIGNLASEASTRVNWHDEFNTFVLTDALVVFTKTRCQVHDTCAVFGCNEISGNNSKGARMVGEIIEQWFI